MCVPVQIYELQSVPRTYKSTICNYLQSEALYCPYKSKICIARKGVHTYKSTICTCKHALRYVMMFAMTEQGFVSQSVRFAYKALLDKENSVLSWWQRHLPFRALHAHTSTNCSYVQIFAVTLSFAYGSYKS